VAMDLRNSELHDLRVEAAIRKHSLYLSLFSQHMAVRGRPRPSLPIREKQAKCLTDPPQFGGGERIPDEVERRRAKRRAGCLCIGWTAAK